jgi:hypothetical protein
MSIPHASLLGLFLMLALPAQAQTAATPPPLEETRQAFLQRVRLASGSLNDYYEKALASLETSLAALGDYEQARAVKARRADLTALSAATPDTAPGLPLLIEKAKLSGSTLATADSLQGWRTTNCAAEWIIPRFTPGTYQLVLTYLMAPRRPPRPQVSPLAPLEEVPMLFHESSLLASAAKNSLPIKLTMTGGENKLLTVEGSIELTRAPVVLRLVNQASSPMNEIIIRDLKLIPLATAASTPLTASTSHPFLEELKLLQAAQASKLTAAQKPLIDVYLSELAAISAPLPEAAEAIASEQQRVKKLLEGKAPKRPVGLKLDNFEELADAHFVPDPANTGDAFIIEHQGQQQRIRLAWIACPPLKPAEQKPLKLVLDRFGISPEAALSLGQSAQEFTALYLEGRPLRLLLRQDHKANEAAQALLFVEDIGLFQNVLIDQGLAVLDAPANKGRNPLESALLTGLQEREAAARKQSPAPGGWGQRTQP